MNKEELKPCPFCGSKDIITSANRYMEIWMFCEDCEAESGAGRTKEEAVKKWNTRKGGSDERPNN